jgi:hypothetical protein
MIILVSFRYSHKELLHYSISVFPKEVYKMTICSILHIHMIQYYFLATQKKITHRKEFCVSAAVCNECTSCRCFCLVASLLRKSNFGMCVFSFCFPLYLMLQDDTS